MGTILQEIIQHKKEEVAPQAKSKDYLLQLKDTEWFYAINERIADKPPITKSLLIAEFKRRSPSNGDINSSVDIQKQCLAYQEAEVSAISILTDATFFGGSINDIRSIKKYITAPILRKEFIVDEIQIYETKSIGASIILLIASVLSQSQLQEYLHLACEIGLQVLIEIHDAQEIKKLPSQQNYLVGINNRSLHTFSVSTQHSLQLMNLLPSDCLKIAESGIQDIKTAQLLIQQGFHGLLVGKYLMQSETPRELCNRLTFEIQ